MKPSAVYIPVSLLPLVKRNTDQSGRSNGQLLIAAIEAQQEKLAQLFGGFTETGGTLFAARRTTPPREDDGPLAPLNIRLWPDDYDTLDSLVAQYGAASRSRFASVVLGAYLQPRRRSSARAEPAVSEAADAVDSKGSAGDAGVDR